jgi:hypothetical protein
MFFPSRPVDPDCSVRDRPVSLDLVILITFQGGSPNGAARLELAATFNGDCVMSEMASQLLASFDSLPPQEQHELITAMLRRTSELPHTFVSDDALVDLADNLFQALDMEESDGSAAQSG